MIAIGGFTGLQLPPSWSTLQNTCATAQEFDTDTFYKINVDNTLVMISSSKMHQQMEN